MHNHPEIKKLMNNMNNLIVSFNTWSADDTGMFYGMKFYNDLLMEAGQFGNVQSEVLLQKDKDTFSLKEGWAFPRKVYFNGEECMLPSPESYPFLPNSAPRSRALFSTFIISAAFFFLTMMWWLFDSEFVLLEILRVNVNVVEYLKHRYRIRWDIYMIV